MNGTAARVARAVSVCAVAAAVAAGCGGSADPGRIEAARSGTAATSGPPQSAKPGPAELCSTDAERFPKRWVEKDTRVLETNPWNATGSICLDTTGDTGFTVKSFKDFTLKAPLSPGAYPNVSTAPGASGLPVPVTALGDATSDWVASAAKVVGSYNLSYDLWYGPTADNCVPGDSAEVMIWLDATDSVKPAGSKVADAQLIGEDVFDVYEAPVNGPHTVISYVRTSPTHTVGDLNLRLFTADALMRGYVPKDSYLCRVQAGFEIWSGGVGLKSSAFTFHNRVGLPVGEVPTGAPGICLRHGSGGAAGTPVTVGGCGDKAVSTNWTVGNDGSLRGGAACLAPSADGSTVALAACTGGGDQRWWPGPDRGLVHRASGRCLDTAGGALAAGTSVELRPCRAVVSQRWSLPYNGKS